MRKLFREISVQTFAEILSIEVSSIPERLVSGTKQPGLMNLRRRAPREGERARKVVERQHVGNARWQRHATPTYVIPKFKGLPNLARAG